VSFKFSKHSATRVCLTCQFQAANHRLTCPITTSHSTSIFDLTNFSFLCQILTSYIYVLRVHCIPASICGVIDAASFHWQSFALYFTYRCYIHYAVTVPCRVVLVVVHLCLSRSTVHCSPTCIDIMLLRCTPSSACRASASPVVGLFAYHLG